MPAYIVPENMVICTHLVDLVSDDSVCKAAKAVPEATQLIEQSFDYVTEIKGVKLFRRRK